MSTSLYDLSVPTFLQTVRSIGGFLDRAATHFAETGVDPDNFVNTRLFDPATGHTHCCNCLRSQPIRLPIDAESYTRRIQTFTQSAASAISLPRHCLVWSWHTAIIRAAAAAEYGIWAVI